MVIQSKFLPQVIKTEAEDLVNGVRDCLKVERARNNSRPYRRRRMIWDSSDHKDYRIVAYTGWKNLENFVTLEERAGVYVFANVELQVKYVGKAGAGRMVKEIEDAIGRNKAFGATKVKALYTNSDERALSLEDTLKEKYDPPNNK